MKIKSKVMKSTYPLMVEKFGTDITEKAMAFAVQKLDELCYENSNESKAVKKHTFDKIYPAISMYWGLQEARISKDDALAFLDFSHSYLAESKAKAMRAMCKLPGMYKKMPAIFKSVTLSTFGEDQGFKATFYDMGKTRCKFDMTKCLYLDTCTRYGCAELTKCFCHTDDVTDGNIHPRLKWNRTKIMGDGGDVCDFDLYIKEDK